MEKAVWKLSPQLWNADLESSAIFLTFAHQIILTHMSYPICFVSLGPGDPELITLKGLKKLRQADIIYCPATISKSGQLLSRAARIIEELEIEKSVVQFFTLPMSKDRTEVWKVYDTLYEKAISARDKEKKVVIVAEGDAGVYSSIQYIYNRSSHAVQTAGYLVSPTTKLTTGMQDGKYNLYRRNTSFHCSGCFSRLAYCQAGRTNHRHTRNADGGRIVEKDQDR